MKTLFLVIAICALGISVYAAPFLVSNAQTGATTYQITGGPTWLNTPVITNGQMKIDLANYVAGTWTLKVKACPDPLWGKCSPEGTLTLTCPTPIILTAPVLSITP